MANPPKTWMVRCEGGELFDDFVTKGVVALGGDSPEPDLSGVGSREEVADRFRQTGGFPEKSIGRIAGVHSRFRLEMADGDRVLTYDPSSRRYKVGTVTGDYRHDTSVIADKQHVRSVNWSHEIDRDDLSPSTRNSLSSMVTVFALSPDAATEIDRLIHGAPRNESAIATAETEDEETLREDVVAQARELVKDNVAQISWSDMQELVAGILRAMGYKTRVSSAGPDRGRDVFASPDGLGLEQPRIVVQVKHRQGPIGANDIRGFIGCLQSADRGLYVSTGGFTREARYEAERSSIPVTLLDVDEVVNLLLEHYDRADARLRSLVPLVPVYWPAN